MPSLSCLIPGKRSSEPWQESKQTLLSFDQRSYRTASLQPPVPWQRLGLSSAHGEVSLWERAVFHIQPMSFFCCCCCCSALCFSGLGVEHDSWFTKNSTGSSHLDILSHWFFVFIIVKCLFTPKKADNCYICVISRGFNTKPIEWGQ